MRFEIELSSTMRLRLIYIFLLWLFLSGLGLKIDAETISTTEWTKLVPSSGLPSEIEIQKGNNNLDVSFFKGRYYFAFRTAPSHFASPKAHLFVLSSPDRKNWRLEKQICLGADLREPRFLAMDSALYFYFFEAGKSPFSFAPEHIWGCHLGANGQFSEIKNLNWDGYVPWRMRRRGDQMFMSAYWGRDLYNGKHKGEVRLLKSENGYDWKPISTQPQTGDKGGEEAEFIFDREGNLWGTIRLEGAGAQVVFADKDSLDKWQTFPTRDKYDSALLFSYKDNIYLVSRRNLDGPSERGGLLPPKLQRNYNLIRYSLTRKCTALWKLDKQKKKLIHLVDFPSTGDTAFPAITEFAAGRFWLLNYSSDIEGPQKNWIRGQLGKTYIYETVLEIGAQ
ncbi:MAG: hypothetical protein IPN95_06070 [Bacteroidetes bacterium]|nr:hypothetical protein [Bacteroidota bacterium]